jgi:hypothetical protein
LTPAARSQQNTRMDTAENGQNSLARIRLWLLRTAFVAAGLGLWFWTQSQIKARGLPDGQSINDGLLEVTEPLHEHFYRHPQSANALLIVSSLIIDAVGISLLLWSIVGPSIRPFIGLLVLFLLRQVCQVTCALPAPPGMIWRDPGFPSLLVTYDVGNDFFFSGHTALAVFGAIELARTRRPLAVALGLLIAMFQVVAVVVLRAHWTMDVYAGVVTAFCAAGVANWLGPYVDDALSFRGRGEKRSTPRNTF